MTTENVSFNSLKESIRNMVTKSIDEELKGIEYSAKDAPTWAHQISEKIIKQLPEKSKEFKYSVTSIIFNKSEGGLHMSSSCYCNATTDGSVIEKYETETLYCIVCLFGFAV